jgi:capsular exopolysaccharide synthesis family protein
MYYGLAAVLGTGLATLLALGLGMLNSVVGATEDLRELEGETPIAPIPRYRVPPKSTPIAFVAPGSEATAAYRVLRNSLQANGLESEHFTLAVTSSRSGEGKTTTTANLGITLANAGRKVILVDSNFRNPELGHLFDIQSAIGLSDLMLGDRTLGQVIRATKHPNLQIIPSGSIPPNYLDLLSSRVIDVIVNDVAAEADIVLFDTPAVSEEQESLLLAKAVSGVLVVAEARHVRADELQRSLGLLRRADARVIAIVLNKARSPRVTRASLPWSRESRMRLRAAHWRSEASFQGHPTHENDHGTSLAD